MKKYIYIVGLIILLGMTLFILPIWNVEDITIKGNSYYTQDDILGSTHFKKGMHILGINKKEMLEQINNLLYIKSAKIDYDFPNDITIEVVEKRAIGYVRFLDSYLCIDEEGYVIEQSTEKRLDLPELEGLKFSQFKIGEKLPVQNSEQLSILREIVKVLDDYDFISEIDTVEVSNIEQIHLYVDRLNVIIGNIRDFDKKVKWLAEIHESYTMGILDLSFIQDKQAILKPIN